MAEPEETSNVTKTEEENTGRNRAEVRVTSQECSESKDDVKDAINNTAIKLEESETRKETVKVEGEISVKAGNIESDDASNVSGKEVEEEDVPANFFDDLMNEDFIDGLNVVDAWDESDVPKATLKTKGQRSPIRFPCKSAADLFKSVKISACGRHYRERDSHLSSPKKPKGKSLSSPRHELDNKPKHKPKMKKLKQSNNEVDVRRDPNKTKRDIQRHKDKCAKDEEARIISEKLKVCETGLVPPGTEMDIDLENFSSKKEDVQEKTLDDFSAKYANRRSHSLERILERRKLETIRDLERLSIERRSLERRIKVRRSLERRSMERRRNYIRGRSRSRSPRRHSPVYGGERRRIEGRKSIEGRIHGRHLSRSGSRNDISMSPASDVSERESWLNNKSRGRTRSPASLSKRSQSFLKELDRLSKPRPKKSFLKELEEKLFPLDISGANASNVMSHQPMVHAMPPTPQIPNFPVGPVPPPVPVPHPNFPPMQQEYDQQFFIGPQPDAQFGLPGCPPGPGLVPYQQGGFMPQDPSYGFPQSHSVSFPHSQPQVNPVSINVPAQVPSNLLNTPIQQQQVTAEKQGGQNLDSYKNLLEEKKITLSDFLSLTAKFSDNAKPVDIKNKIKVITRCQEAIKELSGDAKVGGSFVLRKCRRRPEKSPEVAGKIPSPYRKIAAVRFSFTSQKKQQNEEKPNLGSVLNRLLVKIGSDPVFNTPKESPVSSEEKFTSTAVQRVVKSVNVEKFVQTEEPKCAECEARKFTKTFSVSAQTASVLTFDVSCQVSDETFLKPLRSILKNQSMAHLTPAQLLAAQSAEEDSPPRDSFPSARKITHLMESPSDSKASRTGGVTGNDGYPSQGGSFRSDRGANFDLPSNRFGAVNPNSFDLDRHERFAPEPFHKPVISPNRPNFEKPVRPSSVGRAGAFPNFSNRLNFEPPPFSNYLQKPRNMEQSGEKPRGFFDQSPPGGSGGFQQGGQRF